MKWWYIPVMWIGLSLLAVMAFHIISLGSDMDDIDMGEDE
jgi:hypothetical protein